MLATSILREAKTEPAVQPRPVDGHDRLAVYGKRVNGTEDPSTTGKSEAETAVSMMAGMRSSSTPRIGTRTLPEQEMITPNKTKNVGV